MNQLSLFPQRKPAHYDRFIDEKKYSPRGPKKEKHPEEQREQNISKLEEEIIGDYVDLRVEFDSASAWLNEAKTYLNADSDQKRAFLMKKHPKFRGEGKSSQDISNYSPGEIFGLFNGLYNSYQKSLKKQSEELASFEKENQNILGKYAHN